MTYEYTKYTLLLTYVDMKKIFSFLVLAFTLIGQFQFAGLYVYAQEKIVVEQQKNIQSLDRIEKKLSKASKSLEKKITSVKKKKKLEKK